MSSVGAPNSETPKSSIISTIVSNAGAVVNTLQAVGVIYTLLETIRESRQARGTAIDLTNPRFNLTVRAEQGFLRPMIGRGQECDEMSAILLQKDKPNVLLVGDPGVGKTAIVEGLAQKIVSGQVASRLRNCTIIQLTASDFIEGAAYRGQFEARVLKTIEAIKAMGNVIVFVDETHAMMSVGSGTEGGGNNLTNMLKPHLADGSVRMIGCTTKQEVEVMNQDPAIQRRFTQIVIEEPREKELELIVKAKVLDYEVMHRCSYSEEAIRAVLNARCSLGGKAPDNVSSILDLLGAQAEMKAKNPDSPAPCRILGLKKSQWFLVNTIAASMIGVAFLVKAHQCVPKMDAIEKKFPYPQLNDASPDAIEAVFKQRKRFVNDQMLLVHKCLYGSLLIPLGYRYGIEQCIDLVFRRKKEMQKNPTVIITEKDAVALINAKKASAASPHLPYYL